LSAVDSIEVLETRRTGRRVIFVREDGCGLLVNLIYLRCVDLVDAFTLRTFDLVTAFAFTLRTSVDLVTAFTLRTS
jgi:hypothetical protein